MYSCITDINKKYKNIKNIKNTDYFEIWITSLSSLFIFDGKK